MGHSWARSSAIRHTVKCDHDSCSDVESVDITPESTSTAAESLSKLGFSAWVDRYGDWYYYCADHAPYEMQRVWGAQ